MIGSTIKQARLSKKISRSKLSRQIGISVNQIENIENGKSESITKSTRKLIEVLGLEIEIKQK
jgi:transcriptional regulator with XRE-family HTH domain